MLEGRVSFPGSAIFEFEQLYWSSQQAETRPACRVTPISADDVSSTIQVLKSQGCQFAIKSGGHACFAGASNIEKAVVIDLSNLDQINISRDKTQVSVGAGAQWSSLYPVLDAAKIGVIGGRVVGIGVGGLTLGGGISFHSGRYGFACDNVNNYQVNVLLLFHLLALTKLIACSSQWVSLGCQPSFTSRFVLGITRRWK